jgi:hypothetical protein
MEINIKDANGVIQTVYVPDEAEQNELIEVVGQKSDVEATSDSGTFSIVSFFKRLLGYFTALLNRIPALVGGKIPVKAELDANQQIGISNFPNGLALDVTLGQLLTELQRKANLLQTQPVNVANQISGFATQTTLNDLLTAVNFLAKLTDTQPVQVSNQISGFATDSTLSQIKTVLDNIQAKIIPSPATEAKQNDTITALNSILSELRDDISLSETVWTDDNNVYFVRQAIVNQDSGLITYAYILPNGTTYTPIGNIRLAGLEKDREVIEANFVANTNGTGYNTNDIVSRVDIIDVTASPFVNLAQIWFNRTQQTTISAPTASHLNANPTQNISGNVGVTNQISGFNLEATQLLAKTALENILAKIIPSPATEEKQNDEIAQVTNLNTVIGLQGNTPATADSGTFSFIALFKRLLGKFQVAGQFLATSLGVALPRKLSITGFLSVASTNTNLLDSAGTGIATDVRDYQSGELIVVSTATTGSYTVQVAFDSAFTIGVKTLQLFEKDVQNANPINAAITPTNTTRTFLMNLQGANYLRVNMTSGSANVRPYAVLNQASHIPNQFNIQQATAGNLNATVSGTITANISANQNITPIPQTGQGSSTSHARLSSADTNLVSVKGSAGVINSMVISNLSASFKFFRIYNKASAPVIATDSALVVKYIPIPPNTTLAINTAPFGDRFATGIAYAITNAVGLTDATNIGANEVTVSIQYT